MRSVHHRYARLISDRKLTADAAQAAAADRLDQLIGDLAEFRPPAPVSGGFFGRLMRPASAAAAPRGVYLHGQVGRGKTMLMDLFFDEVTFEPKKRWHFHAFMAAVHERIQRGRATTDGDPIPFVAAEIAGEAPLMCFDELQVTDIADAMILGRLFKHLFDKGVVIVATSNAAPDRLYWNGLNRQLFLPFAQLIDDRMDVIELHAQKDYRLEKIGKLPHYFTPNDAAARTALDTHWSALTSGHETAPSHIDVNGRRVDVPVAASGVARFSFAELCEKPLGAQDYLAIANSFHTLLIDDIPALTQDKRNEARRFITLIDVLYDRQIRLVASAAAEPELLYRVGDGAEAFERTASRLMEMRTWPADQRK